MLQFDEKKLQVIEGVQFIEYSMKNEYLEIKFINVGGAITKIAMASDDYAKNLIVNYQDYSNYLHNGCYLNAIVGRTSNRIKNGTFAINGKTYQVDLNNGVNNLHGGSENLSHMVLNVEMIENGYALSATLPHQENGFPGNVSVKIYYTLNHDTLNISYVATTDQETIVNLTQHAYFNLSGNLETTIYNHELQIAADAVAIVDENLSFTQEILPVANTIFDFNTPTVINPETKDRLPLFEFTSGYDHLYLFNKQGEVATLTDPVSGRRVTVLTDSPSMQFYAGNFLTDEMVFEGNRVGEMHLGCCLETHLVPYDFASQILKPNETYKQAVGYKFTNIK
ncbi:MAG: aldose epimerase family protein [Turicibacter sp.]